MTQFDIAATDREGMFLLPRLPRRPLRISLNRGGFRDQVEPAIASLDVLSARKECDPFLVALTLERDR